MTPETITFNFSPTMGLNTMKSACNVQRPCCTTWRLKWDNLATISSAAGSLASPHEGWDGSSWYRCSSGWRGALTDMSCSRLGLGICAFAHLLRSLKSNERLWVIYLDHSRQISKCEQATVSESLRFLMTNDQPWVIHLGTHNKWAIRSKKID